MFMYRALHIACLSFLFSTYSNLHAADAQAMGRGVTGVSFTQGSTAALYNPALLSHASKEHGVDVILTNVTFSGYVHSDTIDGFTEFDDNDYFTDLSDALDSLDNLEDVTLAQFNDDKAVLNRTTSAVIDLLMQVDEKPVAIDASGFMSLSFSNQYFGVSLYSGLSSFRVEVLPDISECDLQVLNTYTQFINNDIDADNRIMPNNATSTVTCEGTTKQFSIIQDGSFSDPLEDNFSDGTHLLNTRVQGLAVGIFETGLAVSHLFDFDDYQLSVGLTPKLMEVHSLFLSYTVKDIEDDLVEVKDAFTDNRKKTKTFNMDVGLALSLLDDDLTLGLVGKNLVPKHFETNPHVKKRKLPSGEVVEAGESVSESFSLKPEWKAGASYALGGLTLASDVDLTARQPYFTGDKYQFLSAGLDYEFLKIFAFRLGGRMDVLGNTPVQLTTGFSLGNRIFHLDFGAQASTEMTSLGFQLGFGF